MGPPGSAGFRPVLGDILETAGDPRSRSHSSKFSLERMSTPGGGVPSLVSDSVNCSREWRRFLHLESFGIGVGCTSFDNRPCGDSSYAFESDSHARLANLLTSG